MKVLRIKDTRKYPGIIIMITIKNPGQVTLNGRRINDKVTRMIRIPVVKIMPLIENSHRENLS